jgi:hypothetical protein
MITAVSIAVGMIALILLGQTAKERLAVSKQVRPSDQIFPPGMTRVEFHSVNKPGTKIVGNIYIPDDYQAGEKGAALVVSPPASSVKEQAAHYYAEKMRQKGYICLAFDPRGIGETKGLEGNINPYAIAKVVLHAAQSSSPKRRYAPNPDAKLGKFLKRWFGYGLIDRILPGQSIK